MNTISSTSSSIAASEHPAISREQAGHLRHIANLARQLDGDWSKMGAGTGGQESDLSYRYQLAHMAYAVGLAHYHRLPAAPGAVKPIFERLIHKMLLREVWDYWRDTSRGSRFYDPDLAELREGWSDPVVRENIMYSGHLHAMVGMYAALFDDDRYDKPGALKFDLDVRWGLAPETYGYTFRSLNDTIYWQMVENGWLGVACEPNCIFIVCNQYPMLGFRFHDLRHGTTIAEEAATSYMEAWRRRGITTRHGNFVTALRVRQDTVLPQAGPGHDAIVGALMHAWNRDFVRSLDPERVTIGVRRHADGTVSPLAYTTLGKVYAALKNGDPVDEVEDDPTFVWTTPNFGGYSMWFSEIGDTEMLDGMLAHADTHMNPTWENGGLYYPRNDQSYDDAGRMTFMDPVTGNAELAYARLNVSDGLWSLYNHPWDQAHFGAPCLREVPEALDVTRARYDHEHKALVLTVGSFDGHDVDGCLIVGNLEGVGGWTLSRDGRAVAWRTPDGDTQTDGSGRGEVVANELRFTTTVNAPTDLVLALDQ